MARKPYCGVCCNKVHVTQGKDKVLARDHVCRRYIYRVGYKVKFLPGKLVKDKETAEKLMILNAVAEK